MTAPVLTADGVRAKLEEALNGGGLDAAIEQAVNLANAKAGELGAPAPLSAAKPAAMGAAARDVLADLARKQHAEQPARDDRWRDPGADPRNEWAKAQDATEVERGVDVTILGEAAAIVDGSREADYGPPERNLGRIAGMWSAYLEVEITPRDVAWMMVQLKSSRDRNRPKRDNLTDGAGYLRLAEIVETGGRRAAA